MTSYCLLMILLITVALERKLGLAKKFRGKKAKKEGLHVNNDNTNENDNDIHLVVDDADDKSCVIIGPCKCKKAKQEGSEGSDFTTRLKYVGAVRIKQISASSIVELENSKKIKTIFQFSFKLLKSASC